MATLGRWTGGSIALIPGTSWAAPNALFPTEIRNDGSVYGWASSSSTITLPSSNLANGYLLIGSFEFEDTSNGRHNPQGKIIQASGTGDFVGGPTGGYSRDTSEDRAFVRCWAFVNNPSASSTFQFQWKRDNDVPTGGTVISAFEVIPLFYSNHGIYASTNSSLYGGITPNVVTGWSTVAESDTNSIERTTDLITVKGDNKKYLVLASQFFEGRRGRTQRWHGMDIDGTEEHAAKAYSYYRNGSNDESGEMFTHMVETSTANITFEQTSYRGIGVAAGQGGANIDGSTPSIGDHTFVFLELNDSAEGFHTVDDTGGIDLNVTGPVDQVLCRTTGISFNDGTSFTRANDNAMNCEQDMDVLLGANISCAQEVVGTTSRWTSRSHFTVNGAEDNTSRAGDYARNNQGSTDTFGWSANLMSFINVTTGDDIGVSVQELSGGEDGGQFEVQPGWSGFWGINLDSLEDTGSGTDILLADDIESNSEVTLVNIAQQHDFTSNSITSLSEVENTNISQEHSLNSIVSNSLSEVTNSNISQSYDFDANNIESLSEIDVSTLNQTHTLTSVNIEVNTEVSTVNLTEQHILFSNNSESLSEVTINILSESNILFSVDIETSSDVSLSTLNQTHNLFVTNISSVAETTSNSVQQEHAISTNNLQSLSEVSNPELLAVSGADDLLANDLVSISEVTNINIDQIHLLSVVDLTSNSNVSTTSLNEINDLNAVDIESLSEVSEINIAQQHNLLSLDISTLTNVETITISQAHNLFVNDISSLSELSDPNLVAFIPSDDILADDLDSISNASITNIEQIHNLFANYLDSETELSQPILRKLYELNASSIETLSQLYLPRLVAFNEVNQVGLGSSSTSSAKRSSVNLSSKNKQSLTSSQQRDRITSSKSRNVRGSS